MSCSTETSSDSSVLKTAYCEKTESTALPAFMPGICNTNTSQCWWIWIAAKILKLPRLRYKENVGFSVLIKMISHREQEVHPNCIKEQDKYLPGRQLKNLQQHRRSCRKIWQVLISLYKLQQSLILHKSGLSARPARRKSFLMNTPQTMWQNILWSDSSKRFNNNSRTPKGTYVEEKSTKRTPYPQSSMVLVASCFWDDLLQTELLQISVHLSVQPSGVCH